MTDLCLANFYLWISYTLYDGLLDGEEKIDRLPVANFCFRRLLAIFEKNDEKKIFRRHLKKAFDRLDAFYLWEFKKCRTRISDSRLSAEILPDFHNFKKFGERADAFALAMTFLFFAGNKSARKIGYLQKFFEHYVIARQINDDAHDWQEDLKKGHLSSVAVLLLKMFGQKEIKLKEDLERLENIFWRQMVPIISGEILKNCQMARNSLQKLSNDLEPDFFERLLFIPENAAKKALAEAGRSFGIN